MAPHDFHVVDNVLFHGRFPVSDVDAATFKALNTGYGIDRKHVFFWTKPIKGADRRTFEALGEVHGKDAKRAYWMDKPIKGADVSTFSAVRDEYARDARAVYYCNDRIVGADPKTFEVLNSEYTRDAKSIYVNGKKMRGPVPRDFSAWENGYVRKNGKVFYEGELLEDVKAASFKGLGHDYATDGRSVFAFGNRLPDADARSFRVLEPPEYAADAHRVYLHGEPLEGIAPDGFEVLNEHYSRNERIVYFAGRPIKGSDPATFELFARDERFGRDKQRVYYLMSSIPGADPDTFRMLGGPYMKDRRSVYALGLKPQEIDGADAKTFEVLKGHSLYARDKKRVYLTGGGGDLGAGLDQDVIAGADPATFRVLGGGYAVDRHRAYYLASAIEGADPASFEVEEPDHARDRNHRYHRNRAEKDAASSPTQAALLRAFRELCSDTFSDQLVIEVGDENGVELLLPWYSGIDSSDFLSEDLVSFRGLKAAVEDEGGLETSYRSTVKIPKALRKKPADLVGEIRRFAKSMGYPYFETLLEADGRALYWAGHVLEEQREGDENAFWELQERRIFEYCRRFAMAYFGPQKSVLNGAGESVLEELAVFGGEHRYLAINRREEAVRTPLWSSALEAACDSDEVVKLLARIMLQLERDEELRKLAGPGGFTATIRDLELWGDRPAKDLQAFAKQHLDLPVAHYMKRKVPSPAALEG